MTPHPDRASNATRRPRRPRRNGFALVTVIWGVGLITILIVSFASGARLRLQMAFNLAGAAKARLIAEAAIGVEAMQLLKSQGEGPRSAQNAQTLSFAARASGAGLGGAQKTVHAGVPRLCAIDGAAVAIAMEEEAGKVDLNSAPRELLRAMLIGFGAAQNDAEDLVKAIVDFRSAQQREPGGDASDNSPSAKHQPFQTIFELDQVAGMAHSTFRELKPYVTVYSRHPGVDPESAPPALFAALVGLPVEQIRELERVPYPNTLDRADPRFPREFKQLGDSGALLIHAEARLASGQLSVLEAVLDLRAMASGGSETLLPIRELRQSLASRYAEALRAAFTGEFRLPNC